MAAPAVLDGDTFEGVASRVLPVTTSLLPASKRILFCVLLRRSRAFRAEFMRKKRASFGGIPLVRAVEVSAPYLATA